MRNIPSKFFLILSLSAAGVGTQLLIADDLHLDGHALAKPGWPEPIQTRAEYEEATRKKLNDWKEKIGDLKKSVRHSPYFSFDRMQLKTALTYLRANYYQAKRELARLKRAPDTEWRHLGDHIETLFAEMQKINDAASAE